MCYYGVCDAQTDSETVLVTKCDYINNTKIYYYSGTSNKGHSKQGSTKDTVHVPKNSNPHNANVFFTSKRGQPPYEGQKG